MACAQELPPPGDLPGGSIEERLSGFAALLDFSAIPAQQVAAAEILLEDVSVCAIAGARSEECVRIAEAWSATRGPCEASFVGRATQGAWADAAFANAVFAHWFEWDDSYDEGAMHACAVILPVVLAAAERASSQGRQVSGPEFVASFVAALEVACRIARALAPHVNSGWMPTGFAATVGAAAGAARLLGLESDGILSAMGLAASGGALSRQPIGDAVNGKNVLCGLAASRAVEAVRLAECGVVGAPRFLTGDFGTRALFTGGRANLDEVGERLGEVFHVDRIGLKPYPCCRSTHAAIDLALQPREDSGTEPRKIERVELLVPQPMADLCGGPYQLGSNPRVSAQFSLAYTVACALFRHEVTLARLTDEAIRSDTEVANLARRVVTLGKPVPQGRRALSEPVTMTITMTDRPSVTLTTSVAKGAPQRPLTPSERRDKFDAGVAGLLNEDQKGWLRVALSELVVSGPLPLSALLREVKPEQGETRVRQ